MTSEGFQVLGKQLFYFIFYNIDYTTTDLGQVFFRETVLTKSVKHDDIS
jgi:hypothetical protein